MHFNILHEIDSKSVKMPNYLEVSQKSCTFATSKQERRRIAVSNTPVHSQQHVET